MTTMLRRVRAAYRGGSESIEMLVRRYNETPAEWAQRKNHYRNVPVMREVTNKIAWLLYGIQPTVEIWIGERPAGLLPAAGQDLVILPEDITALSSFVRDTMEQNHNWQLMQRATRQRLMEGRAVLKIWGVDADGTASLPFDALRMDLHRTEDVRPIYDPDDPDIILALAEYRRDRWILWTTETVAHVNPDLSIIGDAGEHPVPGCIPFAVFGDGKPMLDDLIEYQKVLINRHSLLWALERSVAFPLGIFSGLPGNQPTVPTGAEGLPGQPKAIDVGGGMRYVYFPDPQGGFSWASPTADTRGLRESYEMELREAIELAGGLPAETGGVDAPSPEQPTTVMLRWLRAFISRDQLIAEATSMEDNRMCVLFEYAHRYVEDLGLVSFDIDAADWEFKFARNPLPQDKIRDREADRAEVLADLRPWSIYVRDHVAPEATAAELQAVIDSLEEQKNSRLSAFAGPLEEGEEEEEENA